MAPYQTSTCCCVNEVKARVKARSIWNEKYAHCYGNRANAKDIKHGFIDGYVETMAGGSGCPPMIAPQRYSGLACLTHGKPAPGAWFEGYPLGAAVAESCGGAHGGESPLNPALLACFKDDTCNPGCCPCEPVGCGCGTSACGCGQTNCGGSCGCNSASTFNHSIHAIQNGMADADGAVIIEHSSAPVPLPTGELPTPAPLTNPAPAESHQAPPMPVPADAPESLSDQVSESVPFDMNGLQPQEAPSAEPPVEMPNLQVRFDMDETQWLFGDVDVARSLLQIDANSYAHDGQAIANTSL